MKERYRGYVIRYYSAHDWLAFIYSPGGTEAVGEFVRATRAEGEEVLLRRVRARIDADRLREDHYDS